MYILWRGMALGQDSLVRPDIRIGVIFVLHVGVAYGFLRQFGREASI